LRQYLYLFYFHFVDKIPPSLSLIKVMEGEDILTVVEVGTAVAGAAAAGAVVAGAAAAGGEDTMRNPSI
jgi:ribosomal protein L12E/L44/L45/RPP1/RPP2